jgi:hypothetical protein
MISSFSINKKITALFAATLCFSNALVAQQITGNTLVDKPEQPMAKQHSVTKIPRIKPFTATYAVLHKGKKVGKGIRKLVYLENNTAEYSYETDISWLIFSDKRKETSKVMLEGSRVIPLHYEYTREGTGRDKHYVWEFDAKNNLATNLKTDHSVAVDFSQPLQDTLSYHLQHRLKMIAHPQQRQFVYPVLKTSGTLKNYVYQYDGEEELMLPYGLVNTIRLKREIVEKKRITYAWFAPELNYLLVKLYQSKAGAEQFEAQLTQLSLLTDQSATAEVATSSPK